VTATFEIIGRATNRFLEEVAGLSLFALKGIRTAFSALPDYKTTVEQMVEIGVGSVSVVIWVCIFAGMNTCLEGCYIFKQLGAQSQMGTFVALSVIREISPLICAAMVAAKAGSGMAAELATMRVKQQIDAIEVMGVNPYWLLISPRLLASVLMLPLLVTIGNFFGLMSGFCVAVIQLKINAGAFMSSVAQSVGVTDLFNGMIKGAVLGFVLSAISCYYGFNASSGAEGVGSATNKAVVVSCVVGIIVNYLLSEWMYG